MHNKLEMHFNWLNTILSIDDDSFFGGGMAGGAAPCGLWDFSSQTRDQTRALGSKNMES